MPLIMQVFFSGLTDSFSLLLTLTDHFQPNLSYLPSLETSENIMKYLIDVWKSAFKQYNPPELTTIT